MGAEIGATTSLFAYDAAMAAYLKATGREAHRRRRRRGRGRPAPRPRGRGRSRRASSTRSSRSTCRRLEPLINGPHTPDLAHQVSEVGDHARAERLADSRSPPRSSARAPTRPTRTSPAPRRSPARPPAKGLPAKTQLLITPGSEQVRATIERDGLLADLEAIGGTVLANACGPCIGQWDRDRPRPRRSSTRSSTATTATSRSATTATPTRWRSSPPPTRSSPYALAGTLDFDPLTDTLTNDAGEQVRLDAARRRGAARPRASTPASPASSPRRPTARGVEVVVAPDSDRLQLLEPFAAVGRQRLRRACRSS